MRGMFAMIGASFLFVMNDTLVKLAAQVWPVSQVMAVRGFIAIAIGFCAVVATGNLGNAGVIKRPLVLARTVSEVSVAVFFISALSMMPLADLTAILMVSPLFITALATIFLGEIVGWRRWSAILGGFGGMLLVIQPWAEAVRGPDYTFAAILGICSVIGVALRDFATRKLTSDVPSVLVMLATAIGSCIAGLLLTPFEPWRSFDIAAFSYLAIAAFLVTGGNFLMIVACRDVDLSVVAPYRYSAVIWAILMGMFIFQEFPNKLALLGMTVIVTSGIYAIHRERVRRKQSAPDENSSLRK